MARKSKEAYSRLENQELFVDREALAKMIEVTVGTVLEAQLSNFIGAERYERTNRRKSSRNGTKPRSMKTTVGELFGAIQGRVSYHEDIDTPTLTEWDEV